MEKLMEAIASGDLVAAKRQFNAHMTMVVEALLSEERLAVARSIVIEGEETKKDDDDEDDEEDHGDDDDDHDEDDEDEKEDK
ncbi:prohead [Aeromonas phage GomatiRiver_11]|nr:hypothetical protein OBDJBBDK_00238 [Aeromonas phage AhFM11]WBF04174.1 prohead [Aeromonas phage GomatiRiver_11]